jgi:hypothetical protein
LAVGTYPTIVPLSTVNHEFGITDDVSNVSMNALLYRLGYNVLVPDSPAITVLDFVSIRLSREEIARLNARYIGKRFAPAPLTALSRVLRDYWIAHTWSGIRISTAGFVLVIMGFTFTASRKRVWRTS